MRRALLVGLLGGALACAFAADCYARGGRGRARGGVVMGPFGPLYDTRSPEWRKSGGNFLVYQQLMEAKLQAQREQLMLKQMQQAQKLQNAKAKGKGKGKTGTTPQPQLEQPVWLDEFGQPIVNHYRPRAKKTKTPSATKPTTEQPKKP